MTAETHSFIDIAAIDEVRGHFAAGDGIVILTSDLGQVIWCNGAGGALLGFSGIEAAIGAGSGLSRSAKRQIEGISGYPWIGSDRYVTVRLAAGMISQTTALRATSLALPGGEAAIMLVSSAPKFSSRDEAESAARAIGGFEEPGNYVAMLDGSGGVLAAAQGFGDLGLGPELLGKLVADARGERVLKRIVRTGSRAMPVGFARLAEEPARYLLITVDEGTAEQDGDVPLAAIDDSQGMAGEATGGDLPGWEQTTTVAPPPEQPAVEDAEDHAEPPSPALILSDDQAQRQEDDREEADAAADAAAPTEPDGVAGTGSQHDSWYFSDRAAPGAQTDPIAIDRDSAPVRFVWRTDAEGRFSAISPEFIAAVGAAAGDVTGSSFAEIAARLGLDPDGEIAGLLERRDTWSGRSVFWPIAGTDLKAPVDLAALPAYGRERQFEGFRGFGVVRVADAVIDPNAVGLKLAGKGSAEPEAAQEPEAPAPAAADLPADPFQGEVPALEIAPKQERRYSDKVIRLAEHRQPPSDKGLTPVERNAFREIGEQLKRASAPAEIETGDATAAQDVSADTMNGAGTSVSGVPETFDAAVLQEDDIQPAALSEPEEIGETLLGQTEATPPVSDETPVRTVAATDAPEWFAAQAPIGIERDETVETPMDVAGTDERMAGAESDETTITVGPDAQPADTGTFVDPDSTTADLDALGDDHETGEPATESAPDEAAPTMADEAISREDSTAREPEVTVPKDRASRSLLDFAAAPEAQDAGDESAVSQATPTATAPESATAETASETQATTETVERPVAAPPLKLDGFTPSAFAERRADTSILAQLPIPVLIHAGDMLHYANDAFFSLTGYGSIEELAEAGGIDVLLSGPAEDRSEGDSSVVLRTRGGEEIPVNAHLQSVPWLGGKALLLTLVRQPAPAPAAPDAEQQQLKDRLAELRTILDTATDGVVLIDNDGMVRSISRPAEALFGYDDDQIVGKPFASLFAIESQRAARDYLSGLSDNGVASVLNDGREVIGREAQGRFIPLFMTIGKLPGDGGYCAVLRDITPWKRAEEELTQARAQAERVSTQKSDFLARVSHEIRTPLNAIIGFSELMLDEKFGPVANDRYRDYLRDINRSGNHVLDLVNDLLDISKIEAGQQEMDYQAVALNDALAETVAMMQPQANRERVIIRSSFASKLPEVVADLRSVRQIALNILSNAVRYTQAGGQVIVSTAHEPNGEVVMRVRDTGVGMTQAEIEQALKPFKQVNALKRARGDGTGLGLPLTKAMVEANRAKFSIYSTPGEGTLVEVTFPSTRVLAE